MKKIFLFVSVAFLMLFSVFLVNGTESENFYTISCNPGEDASKEMRINWHTPISVTNSYVLYTKQTDVSWNNAVKVDGTCFLNSDFTSLNGSGEVFNQNGAVLSNLEPGTQYMYKVTDGDSESEVRYFETGGNDASFSFVWTSDFHTYYDSGTRLTNATNNINEAISLNGKVNFILSTGDIVAHGGTYKWWKQLHSANWMKEYMFATTLGNHDWMTSKGTTVSDGASHNFYSACQNNPKNGYGNQMNVCYYFYYGDALFICLNTEEYSVAQKEWVESVLQNNNAQYIFIFQHYEAFTANGSMKSPGYTRWHEICDKYGVDIFFSGNSHSYVRTKPIYQDKVSEDSSKGTVYMVAPSSDGDRGPETHTPFSKNLDLFEKGWSDGVYQVACSVVKVTPEGISTRLISKGGEVVDSCRISAKRAPTSRNYKELDIDKNVFESSFVLQANNKSFANPKIKYSDSAFDVLRGVKVYNKNTGKVYYDGVIKRASSSLELKNVEKGTLNIGVILNYFDNDVKELSFVLENGHRWGNVSNIEISDENNQYILTWNESINASKVSAIEVHVDGEVYQTVEAGTGKCILPEFQKGKAAIIKLVIKDIDGDVCFENELTYKISMTYIVKFLIDGKVIATQEVSEGKNATAPSVQAKEGYKFVGWDKELNNVKSDLEVSAIFNKIIVKYIVKFLVDEKVVSTQEVLEGENATAPSVQAKEGYEFVGWDKEYNNVTGDLEINAKFKKTENNIITQEKDGCNSACIQSIFSIISILGLSFVIRRRLF